MTAGDRHLLIDEMENKGLSRRSAYQWIKSSLAHIKYNQIVRGSNWLDFRRSLAIAKRLLMGPAGSADLIAYVQNLEGIDAYPSSKSALEKAFKRDRENLRNRLGVVFNYSITTGQYNQIDPGPYMNFELSDKSIRALAPLTQSFSGQVGEHSEIQQSLEAYQREERQ